MSGADYALGHAEAELRRLSTQARLIDPITCRFLEGAGIAKGMRILDIGSGAGDVALLCGELVGPTGDVVGTDLAFAAVERAERRVKNGGSSRISFRQGDPADLNFDELFDATVGRYVLQFMPDPAQSLRSRVHVAQIFKKACDQITNTIPFLTLEWWRAFGEDICSKRAEGFRTVNIRPNHDTRSDHVHQYGITILGVILYEPDQCLRIVHKGFDRKAGFDE